MTLSLNISPCPNDTFMFDALINGRIDTQGLKFDVHYADIEQLNRKVIAGVDVSKVSYAILPEICDSYNVLDSGSALGRGNGPLLVAKSNIDSITADLRVLIPGLHTTANLLIKRLFPQVTEKHESLFSKIAERVASGEYDAGVLIHEGRFTYRQYGLVLLADLGVEWEKATSLPLPLGAIVISKKIPEDIRSTVDKLLGESIRYAFANPSASMAFVKSHAQQVDEEVIGRHIELFVNDFSISLGEKGRLAVKELTGVSI